MCKKKTILVKPCKQLSTSNNIRAEVLQPFNVCNLHLHPHTHHQLLIISAWMASVTSKVHCMCLKHRLLGKKTGRWTMWAKKLWTLSNLFGTVVTSLLSVTGWSKLFFFTSYSFAEADNCKYLKKYVIQIKHTILNTFDQIPQKCVMNHVTNLNNWAVIMGRVSTEPEKKMPLRSIG